MTKQNNKMQWIRLLEENDEWIKKGAKEYFTDYEVSSEVRIPGVLDYAHGSILCGLLSEKDSQGLYSYTIRIKRIEGIDPFEKHTEAVITKKGYHARGGVIGELLSIFSVYFQSRFFLRSVTMGELSSTSIQTKEIKNFRYIPPNKESNYEMFHDQNRNWSKSDGLKNFLDDIKNIDQKFHKEMSQAFSWYSEAIKEIGTDNELFYIKMVSCIESLLQNIQLQADNLDDKIKTFLEKNKFEMKERDEVLSWLNHRKVQQKFSTFIEKYSAGFFKGGNRKAKHCFIKRKDLTKFLKRIYTARSNYLHKGRSMYISFNIPGKEHKKIDLDPSIEMCIDKCRFKESEKLPRTRWFERLVNHCLINFIKEKS